MRGKSKKCYLCCCYHCCCYVSGVTDEQTLIFHKIFQVEKLKRRVSEKIKVLKETICYNVQFCDWSPFRLLPSYFLFSSPFLHLYPPSPIKIFTQKRKSLFYLFYFSFILPFAHTLHQMNCNSA